MAETPSQKEYEKVTFLIVFKKMKRFRLFEPSLSILGFFLVICLVLCFALLDYRSVAKVLKYSAESQRFLWLRFNRPNNIAESKRVDFLSENGSVCNVFDGDWVWDDNYPLYNSRDCKFLDEGFRCTENGRPDLFYTKWRWQPKHCNLPRFNPRTMLEKLRNKRIVFAGDSIGRNQWESLLCIFSSAIANKDTIYEVNGSPITKHKGFLVFKFADYNCTVEYYRAPFLVLQSRPPAGSPANIRTTLKLDKMDWSSLKWRDADVIVFNTGHWWNYEKTIRGGGDWRTGGSCHLEALPDLGSSLVPPHTWARYSIFRDVMSTRSNSSNLGALHVLNVTHLTSRRKDGHSSMYYLGPEVGPAPINRQDCSHWCLPGVPDTWNELLYALFMKREATQTWNTSTIQVQ